MPRPHLRTLAAHVGILPSYIDQSGRRRDTPDHTRVALLRAMGIPAAASEAAARDAMGVMRARAAAELIAPVRVAGQRAACVLALHRAARDTRRWKVEVICEDGARHEVSGRSGRGSVALPPLPLGYHDVRVQLDGEDGRERAAEQRLIVVPRH